MVTLPNEICEMFLIDISEQTILNIYQCPVDSGQLLMSSIHQSLIHFLLFFFTVSSFCLISPVFLQPCGQWTVNFAWICLPTPLSFATLAVPSSVRCLGGAPGGRVPMRTVETSQPRKVKNPCHRPQLFTFILKGSIEIILTEPIEKTTAVRCVRIVLAERTRCSGLMQKHMQHKRKMLQSQKLSRSKNSPTKYV